MAQPVDKTPKSGPTKSEIERIVDLERMGVGGAALGDLASSTAVNALRRLDKAPPAGTEPQALITAVAAALRDAHEKIATLVHESKNPKVKQAYKTIQNVMDDLGLAPEPSTAHPPEPKDGSYPPLVTMPDRPAVPPQHIEVPTQPIDMNAAPGPQGPVSTLAGQPPAQTDALPLRPATRDWFLADQIARNRLRLEWAPARVTVDRPAKVSGEDVTAGEERVARTLMHEVDQAQREVILISPYFVPGVRGMAVAKGLQERGVHLRVLTNSLAATDAPIVHVGYAKYRSALLDDGVELYELRPTLGDRPKMFGTFRSSQASLHVKSVIVDRSTLFVGSMNVDPRSVGLNTETGLIIHSPVLSQAVARLFDAATRSSAYHVTQVNGHLRWTTYENDQEIVTDHEPDVSLGRRMWIQMLAPFTPEELL